MSLVLLYRTRVIDIILTDRQVYVFVMDRIRERAEDGYCRFSERNERRDVDTTDWLFYSMRDAKINNNFIVAQV